jgi:nucleotide-binding universal stress UspA family protein
MRYLVAIDGSTCASRALDKALQVCNPKNDQIYLLCVGPEIDMNEDYKGISIKFVSILIISAELTERIMKLLHPYDVKVRKANVRTFVNQQ